MEVFRNTLSVSPFSGIEMNSNITYIAGTRMVRTRKELQELYIAAGSNEMYARIGTKRYYNGPNEDFNANYHSLEQGLELCRLAAELKMPINLEIMTAYTYMDMMVQQAPDFDEYPELSHLMNSKKWAELDLDEISLILEAYGKLVAEEILDTGCIVNNWNLGNEANFGFAGVSVGLDTAVNPKLKKHSMGEMFIKPNFGAGWLKKNVWCYNAKHMEALKRGILSAYKTRKINTKGITFSTHIATAVANKNYVVQYFSTLKENGFHPDVAGISLYPSSTTIFSDSMSWYRNMITSIKHDCGLKVYIAEFSYPSGKMSGEFSGWSHKIKGYPLNEAGQAEIYQDLVAWGMKNGLCGIRYWAPDFKGWYTMSMFEFQDEHTARAKRIFMDMLEKNHEISDQNLVKKSGISTQKILGFAAIVIALLGSAILYLIN